MAAHLVAKRYGSLRTLLDLPSAQVQDELGDLHGIGPKIADSVAAFFADDTQRGMAEKMLALGVSAEEPPDEAAQEGPLTDKSFCVTGTLSESRPTIHKLIREHGGTVHDRVKKGTTYLVAGAKLGANKRAAAEKHGAEVIDEDALRGMVA